MNFLAPQMLLGLLLVPRRDRVLPLGAASPQQVRGPLHEPGPARQPDAATTVVAPPPAAGPLPRARSPRCSIGLARPTMVFAKPREDATVVLAMDVSGSMRATDVSPTRLDAAKASALSFIAQLPEGIRVGIVSFASEPVTLVSPTADRKQLKDAIDGLTARDGTAMGDALMQVLDIAEKIQTGERRDPGRQRLSEPRSDTRVIGRPRRQRRSRARRPTSRRASRSSPPSSSPTGRSRSARPSRSRRPGAPRPSASRSTPSPSARPTARSRSRTTSVGWSRSTCRPTPRRWQQIASITGATNFTAPTAADLASVYANLESRIGHIEERQEVTFALVGAGLLLVVLGAGLSAVWFGRLP